jgi:hypothetical protein
MREVWDPGISVYCLELSVFTSRRIISYRAKIDLPFHYQTLPSMLYEVMVHEDLGYKLYDAIIVEGCRLEQLGFCHECQELILKSQSRSSVELQKSIPYNSFSKTRLSRLVQRGCYCITPH